MGKNCGKHFKCVSKDDFQPLGAIALGIFTAGLIIIDIVVAIIAGSAIPGLGFVAWATFVAAVFDLCRFLHGGKLICIEETICIIGRIMELIPVGADKTGLEEMDDDFTFNILPSPHSPTELLAEVVMSDPYQGRFMQEQSQSSDLGLGYSGQSVKFDAIDHDTEVFHCEVKGCRVHDVCNVLKAMSIVGIAVPIICAIPILGWLACLIAAAIWLAVTAAAVAIAWAATHNGDINDVYDSASGELRAADPITGEGGAVILVKGDWVYDAGHSGWNENHPVRHVQKLTDDIDNIYQGMAKADPDLVEKFKKEVLDVWCFHVREPDDEDGKKAQEDPENGWKIHPHIDGCKKPPVIK